MFGRKKHDKHEEHAADESWLLPYSDVMTLMLAIFIVLFATSKADQAKLEEMGAAFRNTFGISSEGSMEPGISSEDSVEFGIFPERSTEFTIIPIELSQFKQQAPGTGKEGSGQGQAGDFYAYHEMDKLKEMKSLLESYFEGEGLSADIATHIDERGLVISLYDTVLFDSGKADLKPASVLDVIEIGKIINKLQNYIRVEGHTDNVPIHTAQYNSNWELSTLRACAVVELLIAQSSISSEKIVAVGYADNKPVADNDTADGRSKNRRVDIIILSGKFNDLENQLIDDNAVIDTSMTTTP